jgi:hypothetical protein
MSHPLRGKLALFAVLSVLDLALTWYLLQGRPGRFREANPVAQWWLVNFGWVGLSAFKVGLVLFAASAALFVARHRPRAGGALLSFACLATTVVVVYSGGLVASACGQPDLVPVRDLAVLNAESQQLDAELARRNAYRHLRHRLSEDLLAGRCTLEEAVATLAATPRGRDPLWLSQLSELYAVLSPHECLAADLLHSVGERLQAGTTAAVAQTEWVVAKPTEAAEL